MVSAETFQKRLVIIWNLNKCLLTIFFQVEELPFLLTKAGEKERLKDFISDPYVFIQMANNEDGIFELIKAWKYVKALFISEKCGFTFCTFGMLFN